MQIILFYNIYLYYKLKASNSKVELLAFLIYKYNSLSHRTKYHVTDYTIVLSEELERSIITYIAGYIII